MPRLPSILLPLLLAADLCAAAPLTAARLFMVHSYDPGDVCARPQAEGALATLRGHGWTPGHNLEVASYYMDTKRTHTSAEAIHRQGQAARAQIAAFRPDVVLVLDDNAIREVMLPLVGRMDLAVVFSGMNGQPEDYNRMRHFMDDRRRPGSNVTGIYEKLHLVKSLAVMGAALSGFRPQDRVVGITDDSATGRAISRQFAIELADAPPGVGWELRQVHDFSEYQALIRAVNQDDHVRAIYPAALSLKGASGETYGPPGIFAWTLAHNRKPEMALNYDFTRNGLFGGAAVDFGAMGRAAGDKIGRILAGAPAGSLPIEEARDFAIVFNLKRAQTLGIKIPAALLTAADHVYR